MNCWTRCGRRQLLTIHQLMVKSSFALSRVHRGIPSPQERFACEGHTCSRFPSPTFFVLAMHKRVCAQPNAATGSTRRNKRRPCNCICRGRPPESRTTHRFCEKKGRSPCYGSQKLRRGVHDTGARSYGVATHVCSNIVNNRSDNIIYNIFNIIVIT